MRKTNLSLRALAMLSAGLLLVAASCKKDDDKNVAPVTGTAFTATTEAHRGDSKTGMNGDHDVLWKQGDNIVVYNSDNIDNIAPNHYTFTATTSESSTTGFENGDVPEDFYSHVPFNAFYPSNFTYNNLSEGHWTLPASQQYDASGFAANVNPMAAWSNDNKLEFKNMCGLLEIRMYGDFNVSTITVKSEDESLSGAGVFNWKDESAKGEPNFVIENGTKSVTLTCGDVPLSADENTSFYMVLPTGVFDKTPFTVEVKATDGSVFTKKAANWADNSIVRSMIRQMPPIECNYVPATGIALDYATMGFVMGGATTSAELTATLEPYNTTDVGDWEWQSSNTAVATVSEGNSVATVTAVGVGTTDITVTAKSFTATCKVTVVPEGRGAIPGLFSVNSEKQVLFSKGNLYYSVDDATWAFYEHQYDYTPSYDSKIACLFCHGYKEDYSTLPNDFEDHSPFSDWGDAEEVKTCIGNNWYTLSQAEWEHILYNRSNTVTRYAAAKVKNKDGILIFPDGTGTKIGGVSIIFSTNSSDNNINDAQWSRLELAGVVFLPKAGYRNNPTGFSTGYGSYYTTITRHLYFTNSAFYGLNSGDGQVGRSVRLALPLENISSSEK